MARRRRRPIASLSGLAVAVVACATTPRTPPTLDHRELVEKVGWAETLRTVDEFCRLDSPQYTAMHCTVASRGEAYVAAYEDFWPDHPMQVRVEAVSMELAGELVGEPIPNAAAERAFVVGIRLRLPKPPPGIRWNLTEMAIVDYYGGENPAKVTYDHRASDPEEFVIAMGGTPRPSTIRLAEEKGVSVEEMPDDERLTFTDDKRYGIERPNASASSASSSATSSSGPKLSGRDVVVLSPLAVPLAIVAILNALSPKPKATSPAFRRYYDEIDAARRAENEVWAADPGVAARLRLWQGAWERPGDPESTEILLTYGVQRMRYYSPMPNYDDYAASVFVYVRPQVGDLVLMPILVQFEIPRNGDLPDDVAAIEAKGWMPVSGYPEPEPSWQIDKHALQFHRPPPPPV